MPARLVRRALPHGIPLIIVCAAVGTLLARQPLLTGVPVDVTPPPVSGPLIVDQPVNPPTVRVQVGGRVAACTVDQGALYVCPALPHGQQVGLSDDWQPR